MGRNNKIFIGFLIFTIASFVYSAWVGNEQVDKRVEDYKLYLGIKEYINTGKNLDVALHDLEYLEKHYPQTDTLNLDKASVYLLLDQHDKVEEYIQKAFDISPNLEKSINLLLVYAEAAYNNKNLEKSQEMLDKIMDLEVIPDEYKDRVDSLIKKF